MLFTMTSKGRLLCRKAGLIVLATAVVAGCGGPANVVDPGPTQSVQFYFAGTEDSGALHVHVDWTQTGHNIVLRSPCTPQDNCRIYTFSAEGNTQLGSTFPVDLSSGSGTFADPGITFAVTTVNGRTFTFTGTVATSGAQVQMVGTLSGATHPASRLVLDKQNQ
jgi:hypothetical protein